MGKGVEDVSKYLGRITAVSNHLWLVIELILSERMMEFIYFVSLNKHKF